MDTDAFSNCASRLLLDPYPSLTGVEDTHFVVARVSTKDLFNRRKRTLHASASDLQSFSGGTNDAAGSVTLDWRLTLKRKR